MICGRVSISTVSGPLLRMTSVNATRVPVAAVCREARVTATHGTVTVRGGVVSESAFEDDNPFNQYRTASVRVG